MSPCRVCACARPWRSHGRPSRLWLRPVGELQAQAHPYLPSLQPDILEVVVHPPIAAETCEEAPVGCSISKEEKGFCTPTPACWARGV